MKRILLIAAMLLITAACGSGGSFETEHHYWLGNEGEVVIFTRMAHVFRGEYIDPNFQERASVPIVGIIDKEGNVRGAGFDINDGSLYAQFTGKITDNVFEANWGPVPNASGEHRSWNLKQQKLSPDAEQEIAKHPDAFYNWLFPEFELCTSNSAARPRATPFLPEETAVVGGRLYGYQIGEWDKREIRIAPAAKAGEVDFQIKVEINGMFWIKIDIQGTARLSGNSFRYNEKGYEFEVAVYNDFAVITTINGTVDLSDFKDQDVFDIKLDEVYPLLPKGFVDKQFYEINFYCNKDGLGNTDGNSPANILKIFKAVLTNKTTHIDAEKEQNIFLKDYFRDKNVAETEMRFAIVDLDGDGIPEVLIEHFPGEIRVLRYQAGKVYGFTFDGRGMNGIKKDGSFEWSNSAFNSGIGRQTFYEANTERVIVAEAASEPNEEESSYHIFYAQVTQQQSQALWAVHNEKEDVRWTPFTTDNVNSLKEWNELQYYYSSIPDRMFPVPTRQGAVIPYNDFSPPEEGMTSTAYIYDDAGFTESYKQQLRGAGFVQQEGGPEWFESWWRYDRSSDGASLIVELLNEEGRLVISMYINYLK
ncbi:MAG: hypothetical protein FWH23_02645 [Bacteroidales bacterium]|nr:hypothetical protein [Bacteroidales bacterium]